MDTVFQVWDRGSNNLLDEYESLDAAYADLAAWLDREGAVALDDLVLTADGGAGPEMLAAGASLAEQVRARTNVEARRP